ncbi:Acetyltransferase (GNAT) domain-containing protein [Marininema mesophilum]|uniref:Acetyltransferase (GNAT) domain-containing protein n=1 Tax=Marininema mesophilum TaxID=1048340 RepID=A0A1H2VS58_9BACL|nr:Acetyltransferase (GNAT) domain-containing protein [Marininema mesophilum]
MNKPILLPGERIYLRPISVEDSELYFRMMFNSETRRLTGTQKCFSREGIKRYIEGLSQNSSSLLLLIAFIEDDTVIGDIQLLNIHPTNRNCFILGRSNPSRQRLRL